MTRRSITDPRHWSELARNMRELADRLTGASREAASNIAADYQRFADKMAEHEIELRDAPPLVPSAEAAEEKLAERT